MKKIVFIILVILVVSGIAVADIYRSPFFILVHDQVQPERVYEMTQAIKSGQIPPRIVPNLGYGFGYPLFNFYAPFPYYIGALGSFLGLGILNAAKFMAVFGFIAAAFSMYYAGAQLWGRKGGLFAAVLYTLAPYHAVQLYVRGSVGELYAYALLPLIYVGLIELYKEKIARKKLLIGMVSLALLAISHTITLYIVLYLFAIQSIIGLIVTVIRKNNVKQYLYKNIVFISAPLLITAYFWLPAFTELSLVQFSTHSGNQVNYKDHFVALSQLWNSAWGFGGSAQGIDRDGMSFMIGKAIVITAVLSIILALNYNKKLKNWDHQRAVTIIFGCVAFFAILHMLLSSNFVWQTVPFFILIQFPWRFLTIVTSALAFIAPGIFILLPTLKRLRNQQIIYGAVIIGVAFYMLFPLNLKNFPQSKYFYANGYYQKTDKDIINTNHLRYEASRISDEYMPKELIRPENSASVSKDQIICTNACTISQVEISPSQYKFIVNTEHKTIVYIDKIYFPKMNVEINGKKATIIKDFANKIGTVVEPGKSGVTFTIKDTPLRAAGNTISILSCIGIIVYICKQRMDKQKI